MVADIVADIDPNTVTNKTFKLKKKGVKKPVKVTVSFDPATDTATLDPVNRRLDNAARQSGELTTRAETNTRTMLQGLLRSLGYTDVTVTFR